MTLYLGVDGGGTSTSFILYDSNGKEIESYKHQSLHFMSVGYEGMTKGFSEVKSVFKEMGYDPNTFEIVIGLGGYGADPKIREKIEAAILPVFPQATLMSDSQLAMIASLDNDKGVFLISGTGSIAMYNDGETIYRQGGYGYHIGDEGSGFWIGKKILELFTQEADGRLDRSDVSELVTEYFKLTSPYDLISKLGEEPTQYRFQVASLGGLFANSMNPHIHKIFIDAGKELAKLANGFKIHEKTKIAFGGSVLDKNELVKKSCISALNHYFDVYQSNNNVEYAAFLIKNIKV